MGWPQWVVTIVIVLATGSYIGDGTKKATDKLVALVMNGGLLWLLHMGGFYH